MGDRDEAVQSYRRYVESGARARDQRQREACMSGQCEHMAGKPASVEPPTGVTALKFDGPQWNAVIDSGPANPAEVLLEWLDTEVVDLGQTAAFADGHGLKWRWTRPYRGRPRKSDGDTYAWHNDTLT